MANEDKLATFQVLLEKATSPTTMANATDKTCLILSGGVDTCALLAAATNTGLRFDAAISVCCGNDCPDRAFCQAAAQEYGLTHHLIELTPHELVQHYLQPCVQILETFDGMTLRNSLVIAAAFDKAKELGMTHVVVGDGADELLGGYSFMWGSAEDPAAWKEKRNKMCRQWTFATEALAKHYKVISHAPFMDPPLVDWVLNHVEREDCIATRPIQLVYEGERIDHITGKLLLRQAYDTVASWRRKDPIEVGSGATVLGHDEFWKDQLSDEEFQRQVEVLKEHGFTNIKTKETLINFRAFEQVFGKLGKDYSSRFRLEVGKGCAGCCFEISDTQMFCHLCGMYPAQRRSEEANQANLDTS